MNIEKTFAQELAWGDPIVYEGIVLHPVTVQYMMYFMQCVSVLQISPMELPDIKYKSMSRLQFILECIRTYGTAESTPFTDSVPKLFMTLMKMILGENQSFGLINPKDHRLDGKIIRIVREENGSTTELILTPKKFETFRKVVLIQNGIDISDEELDPIMRRVYYEDMQRIQQRTGNQSSITDEDKLDLLSLHNHCQRSDLKSMTIREYTLKIDKLLAKDVYLAQLNGQMSGFVKFKKEPRHWLIKQTNKEKILSHFRTEDDIKGLLNDKG